MSYEYQSGCRYPCEVIANDFVQPGDSGVMKHEEQSVLTLITCDSYNQRTGADLRRVAVRAVLIDVHLVR